MHHSFRVAKRFDIALKPGVNEYHQQPEELTAVSKDDGHFALYEYGDALPRAKLYGTWQVNTNSDAILNTLADINFDPQKTVLISDPGEGSARQRHE